MLGLPCTTLFPYTTVFRSVNDLPESIERFKQPRNLCGSVSLGGSLPEPPLVLGFGQINPTQQQRKLFVTQDDLALRITGLRPGETPFLQPLGTDPESASVPDEDLQPIALAVAEQEKVPAQRLTRQSIPNQTVQPFEPLAHVGDPGGQIHPCSWAQSKHGLRPLQDAHQAFERTSIKIRMHLY